MLNTRHLRSALVRFKRAVQLDPNDANPYVGLAALYNVTRQYGRADAEFAIAVGLAPDSGSPLAEWGDALLERGQHRAALSKYDRAIAIDPLDHTAYYRRARALDALGERDKASVDIQTALRLAPWSLEAHIVYAQFLGASDEKKAEDEYAAAIQLDPASPAAYMARGTALFQWGNEERAVRDFTVATRLDPSSAEPDLRWANALAVKGDGEGALRHVKEAIAIDPRSAMGWQREGDLLTDAGRYDEAIQAYSTAIVVDEAYVVSHRALGNLLSKLQRYADARNAYTRALAIAPDDVATLLSRAECAKASGAPDDAARDVLHAIVVAETKEERRAATEHLDLIHPR